MRRSLMDRKMLVKFDQILGFHQQLRVLIITD